MIPVSKIFTVQDPSNALLSYTQKGIEFFEKIGQFSKEKAAIEEEYSSKLKNLSKKYAKKAEEDDEILKSVTYIGSFNTYLQQVDQIAGKHHAAAESIREDVVSYVTSKTCQLRSSRKNAINDLKTINDNLENQINDMLKSGKIYSRSYKDAESAYQKFYKADKNMEISRLELEKARTHANTRNEICEKAKSDYAKTVTSTNSEQKKYHEELLPVIFSRLKAVDKECIGDMRHVLQKITSIEEFREESTGSCRRKMQSEISKINPEDDAQLVLESVEATMEKPTPFEIDDLGDPKDCDSRTNDSTDGKPRIEVAASSYHIPKSPNKAQKSQRIIRNFLGIKEKDSEPTESPKEVYIDKDKPPHVRLSCLRSKIRSLEKQLDQAVQGREGLTRLQQAYYDNPKHGNPAACTEQLIKHAKDIETLNTNIQNLKEFYTLLEMSVEGMPSERSFGGRDTPDTTRSMSGCSTILSSSKTLEDGMSGDRGTSSGEDSAKNMLRQFLSSPKRMMSSPKTPKNTHFPISTTPVRRKKDISSPVLRSSFSGAVRKMSAPGSATSSPHRSVSSPMKINKSETAILVTVLFEFVKSSAETMTIQPGEELYIQEEDTGDGWTRARKKKGQEAGFVPTSYLQFPVSTSSITPP
ncbi:CBN-TOCA-2 protein [Caenorhabditis brenneri]|uniref:CBN-TOCA-2 protein n=1 Tax=Caenorhabditis brenneri TaxID=135651 RepID=G0ML47_CAEBE|nr:CBN-TOCA-2 protein [Caenorhabditis brenneri]